MKKGILSKSKAITMYMEEVKKDLIKYLDIDIGDDISMASASHINNDDEGCMVGEAQSGHSNDEIDIDALLAKFQEQVEESSNKATCKSKNKICNEDPTRQNNWGNTPSNFNKAEEFLEDSKYF
ncbi:hypothetical protein H5410_060500 [Solanum commersonii]|uniref:Uncharacterized protein n=1 Tax=Solanum commersonii TaxID=4109 RepID=A0A9J5W6R4_SOLCO|nr:hypothetical protein H5410_060500 [Solanum commersonii]